MEVSYFACDMDDEDSRREATRHQIELDGQPYEIDLCYQHESDLRDMASVYITRARKADRGAKPRRSQADRRRSARIRAWAKAKGMDVPDRGRLDDAVLAGYYAEHPAERSAA